MDITSIYLNGTDDISSAVKMRFDRNIGLHISQVTDIFPQATSLKYKVENQRWT